MKWQKLTPWNWFKKEESDIINTPAVRKHDTMQDTYPLSQLHREIDRLFEDRFRDFSMPSLFENPFKNIGLDLLKPNLDIKETKKGYVVSIEMPGVDKDEVNVTIDGSTLTVSGEKRQETKRDDEDYHYIERSYGSFRRVLDLPEDVDPNKLDAKFKKGVLTLNIGKVALGKHSGKKIEIQQDED